MLLSLEPCALPQSAQVLQAGQNIALLFSASGSAALVGFWVCFIATQLCSIDQALLRGDERRCWGAAGWVPFTKLLSAGVLLAVHCRGLPLTEEASQPCTGAAGDAAGDACQGTHLAAWNLSAGLCTATACSAVA